MACNEMVVETLWVSMLSASAGRATTIVLVAASAASPASSAPASPRALPYKRHDGDVRLMSVSPFCVVVVLSSRLLHSAHAIGETFLLFLPVPSGSAPYLEVV